MGQWNLPCSYDDWTPLIISCEYDADEGWKGPNAGEASKQRDVSNFMFILQLPWIYVPDDCPTSFPQPPYLEPQKKSPCVINPLFSTVCLAKGSPQIISVFIYRYTSTSVDKDRSNSQDLQNPQHPITPGTKSKQTNKTPQFISSCCVTVPYQNLIDLFSHFQLSFIGMKRSFERHWQLQRKSWKIHLWHRALHQIQLDSEWRSPQPRCAGPENWKKTTTLLSQTAGGSYGHSQIDIKLS